MATNFFEGIRTVPLEESPSTDSAPTESNDVFAGIRTVPLSQEDIKKHAEPKKDASIVPDKNNEDSFSAFTRSAVKGAGNMALDLGDVAATVLKHLGAKDTGEALSSSIHKGREYTAPTSDIELTSPKASAAGEATGYGLSSLLMPAGIVRGAVGALKEAPAIGALIKSAGPTLSGATREAATGALGGAAMAPEGEKGIGAALGGLFGSAAGAVGGKVGGALEEGYNYIKPALARADNLGLAKNSDEALALARTDLAGRGLNDIKTNINEQLAGNIQKQADLIKPQDHFVPDKSPNQMLLQRQQEGFQKASAAKNEAYQPLIDSTATVKTPDLNIKYEATNKYLPEKLLPQDATFKDLQDFRQELDTGIAVAKAKSAKDIDAKRAVGELVGIRNQVTENMHNVASEAGIPDQFAKAEDIYRNTYLPFRTFSKSGKLQSEAESDAAWKKINTLMDSSNPNPKELKDLVSTLGPEGKDLVGWTKIQNAFTRAKSDNDFDIAGFNKEVNSAKVNGLDEIYSTPQYKAAMHGINRILQDGKDSVAAKTNRLYIPFISPIIEHAMQTNTGLKMIQKLGKADRTSKAYKAGIQALITGGGNLMLQHPWTRETDKLPGDQQ